MGKFASKMVEPRRRPLSLAEAEEKVRRGVAKDKARIDAANERHRDKIGEFLGSTVHRTNESWPHLKGRNGQPVSCSRYYPIINVALDVVPRLSDVDAADIEEKRRILGAAGIRYGALDYGMELVELVAQVGIQ